MGTAKVSPPGERAAGTGSRHRGATVLTMPAVGILPFDPSSLPNVSRRPALECPPMALALVTGGNRGIGLEVARQLGRDGMRVLLGSRDRLRGEAAAAGLRGRVLT